MKFAVLVLKSALRNKRRTVLTVLSLAVSLFLLVTLQTVLYELSSPTLSPESDLRLWTRHAVSLANVIPLAYKDRIARVPGVKDVMVANWFGGIYIDESNFFAQFAVDADRYFRIYPELQIPVDQRLAFERERTGAVAGVRLAQRFGWKIGDRVTLKGTFYPFDAELKIVGFFTSPNPPDEATLTFHYDYLYELMNRRGDAGTFCILAESREALPHIARSVDQMFRNSSAPTKTETEKAFVQSFSGMLGNVKMLITSISVVVVFTILLVTAASMGMTIRERTSEVAVLKTLGYTSRLVLALLLSEALLIALAGAALGCGGAKLVYSTADLQRATGGFIVQLRVQNSAMLLGISLGAAIGLFSAAIPAVRASRLSIAEALRHIG